MDISKQFSIIKAAYEEFKVLVGQHPIAAIAMAILLPVGVAATCVWGVRKVIILNQQESKPKIANKPLEVKVTETTDLTAGIWNKKTIALGALATLGLGAIIYYYYQTPAEIVKIVKPIPFPSPLQSSINSTVCSIFEVIKDVQKPITEAISSLPKPAPFTATDLNLVCQLNESITAPAVNIVKSVGDALPSVVIPAIGPAPLSLSNITAPMTNLIKWSTNPFQSSVSSNVSSIYNLVVDNTTAAVENVTASVPSVTTSVINTPTWISNPFQSTASLNVSSICNLFVDNATGVIKNVAASVPTVAAPVIKTATWIPNPFQSSASLNTSSIYNLIVDNATAVVKNINASIPTIAVPLVKAPKLIPNPFQVPLISNVSSSICQIVENVAPVVINPIVETAKKVVKSDAFSIADKLRLAATEGVLLGVLYDKLYPLKRREPILAPAKTTTYNAKGRLVPVLASTKKVGSYLPSIGIVGGAIVGTIANLWHNQSIYAKSSMLCMPMKQWTVLSKVNLVQQGVTKALGLGFNLIPGVIVLAPALGVAAHKYFQSTISSEKIKSRELVGRVGVDVAKTFIMSVIAIVCKQAIKLNQNNFDPSGHIMLKAAGLHGLMVSQKYINDPVTKTVSSLFALYSVVTDSLFLANTAGCFHTPLDIVAGSVYALGIYTLTNRLVDSAVDYYHEWQANNPQKIIPEEIKDFISQHPQCYKEVVADVKNKYGIEHLESAKLFAAKKILFKDSDGFFMKINRDNCYHSPECNTAISLTADLFTDKEEFDGFHMMIKKQLIKKGIETFFADQIINKIREKIHQNQIKLVSTEEI